MQTLDAGMLLRTNLSSHLSGSVFGRTDFSRIYIFGPPDSFADFVAGFFLLILVGKSAQKNRPGKSPAKSSKFILQESPTHFCRGAGPTFETFSIFREILPLILHLFKMLLSISVLACVLVTLLCQFDQNPTVELD